MNMSKGFFPFVSASSTRAGKKMATRYLHKNAANKNNVASAQCCCLLSCHPAANAHIPKAQQQMEPESRVALRDTSTAGASRALTAAAATPIVFENTRLANPYVAATVTLPSTA